LLFDQNGSRVLANAERCGLRGSDASTLSP
jgi:hypothetical protein